MENIYKPYIPTKEELDDMGFTFCDYPHHETYFKHAGPLEITYEHSEKLKNWHIYGDNFYPSSKQDIETLIRLFTNPQSNGQK